MSKYYYLISSLPELTLEDSKLSYTVAGFKEELYSNLSASDKKLINLFYLKYDNANLLKLLKDKDVGIDSRGNYTAGELLELIKTVKESGTVDTQLFPAYFPTFITDYFTESFETVILPEDKLASLYYAHGMKCGNAFISAWFELNLNMNNILSALTGRKYKFDVSAAIVGEGEVATALKSSGARDFGLGAEVDYLDALMKISEINELVEREKKIDALRWDWIEDAIFFEYFTIERLFAYLLKLEMIERWLTLDKERGSELFRKIIDALKDEVRIPAEFK